MADNNMKVFSGNAGYAGFYGPSATGNDVTLTIARASKKSDGKNALANSGFLADAYNIQWGRAVDVRRVFNNNKPIAVVGFGQGTITLQGLLGTYAGFKTIIGGDATGSTDGNKDLCDPLTIEIKGSGAYNSCDGKGGVNAGTQGGVNFKLTGCLLSTIAVTGQIETQSGMLLQQANVTFSIGGFEILPAKKITDGLASRNDAQFGSQMQAMYGGLA